MKLEENLVGMLIIFIVSRQEDVEFACLFFLMHAGGHRNVEEEREKMRSAQLVALERAQMAAKRYVHPMTGLNVYNLPSKVLP